MAYLQELRKLGLFFQDKLFSFSQFASRAVYAEGRQAHNALFMSGNVVLDETVTIGTNVFKFKAITTDTTKTASALNNTDTISAVTLSGAPAVALAVGDLIRIDNEIMKIIIADTVNFIYTVIRARCGTALATHTAATACFEAAAQTTTEIPVGYNATLTPTVITAALIAEINNAIAGSTRATVKASTIWDPGPTFADGVSRPDAARAGKVIAYPNSTDTVFIVSAIPEASVLATTETMTNAAWNEGATMVGGAAAGNLRSKTFSRVPTAADVTQGKMFYKLAFTPRAVYVQVTVTATGIYKVWNGATTITADPTGSGCTVTIDNSGATDWAATDTVVVGCDE